MSCLINPQCEGRLHTWVPTLRVCRRLLIARAGLDNPWLNGTIDRFVQQALDVGASLDLMNHPAGRHSFDILDDDLRSREIIRRTLAFLRDCLECERE